MVEDGTQPDRHLSPQAHHPSGTTLADLQAQSTDGTRVSVDDSVEIDIDMLQPADISKSDADDGSDMMRFAIAGTSSNSPTQSDKVIQDKPTDELGKPQRMEEDRAAKEERLEQAEDTQNDIRAINDSTEEVLDAHAIPKRPPLTHSNPSFANPTKTSRGWQTQKHQLSTSSASRPSSTDKSVSCGSSSHATFLPDAGSRTSEDNLGLFHTPGKRVAVVTWVDSQLDEITSHERQYEDYRPGTAGASTRGSDQLSEATDTETGTENFLASLNEVMAAPECAGDDLDPEVLQEQLLQAEEKHHYLNGELRELRADVDHLCHAWLEACDAASIDAKAVAHYQFCVPDSDVDADTRAAAHAALEINVLCRWISNTRNEIEILQLQVKSRKEVFVHHQARSASHHDISSGDADAQHGPTDWKTMYESSKQYFDSLYSRYKQLQIEAERMYQPNLERECKKLQTKLIAAEDSKANLTDEVRNAQVEARFWQTEAEQCNARLEERLMRFEEQSQLQNEEMLSAVQEYRSKVNDSKYWDRDGLMMKNELLEREQAKLNYEICRLVKANADKDDQIKTLVERQQQEHSTWYAGGNTVQATGGKSRQSRWHELEKLREKQRKRVEQEEAEEALKEKIGQACQRYERATIDRALLWVRKKGGSISDLDFDGA
ncbi:hypothetical protein EJ07DRAFT_171793 [Lizonia empirigonia]|nr:hypothetical protein EJ07DRAFT_171793 [Lizonia empirigonia]